jgi:hypothetical protein
MYDWRNPSGVWNPRDAIRAEWLVGFARITALLSATDQVVLVVSLDRMMSPALAVALPVQIDRAQHADTAAALASKVR